MPGTSLSRGFPLFLILLSATAFCVFASESERESRAGVASLRDAPVSTVGHSPQSSGADQSSGAAAEVDAKAGADSASPMVLIPGGEFLMGSGDGDDTPVHKVYINSFYLDQYEVTNAQYFLFCRDTERGLPEFWGWDQFHCGPDYPDHPIVGVSWGDAKAYAEWCGKRLPTEAEWEYAARGGLEGKKYPNGDTIDSTMANYFIKNVTKGTVPVGSYPPNGFDLYDMTGNVVEWVVDYYGWDYYSTSPYENPPGPEKGKFRVIRGGGWHSGPYCNRVYFRSGLRGNWVDFNVGFRCARDYTK